MSIPATSINIEKCPENNKLDIRENHIDENTTNNFCFNNMEVDIISDVTSDQLITIEPIKIIEPNEKGSLSDEGSSYHPPSKSSKSSKNSNYVQNNSLSLLRNVYTNETSSDSDQISQLSSEHTSNTKKTKNRKQNIDQSKWKRSVQKKCRMSGIQYVNRSNKIVPKKNT